MNEEEQVELNNALEQVLIEFSPMLEEWRAGRPITKLCYGLNNAHLSALDKLEEAYRMPNQ